MLQSAQERAEAARLAIRDAIAGGVPPDVLYEMVAELPYQLDLDGVAHLLADDGKPGCQVDSGESRNDDADAMYEPGQLPDGLIDLPSASVKFRISLKTLQSWLHRGKLPRRGRLRGKAAGGGYNVTEEARILHCRDNPGRPWEKKRKAESANA